MIDTKSEQTALAFFDERGWFRDGKYTNEGLKSLAELLHPLSTVWGGDNWGPVFHELMGKIVPFSTELVVIREGAALLTWREFEGTAGWHIPGSFVNPREDWQMTVSRIAKRELGCDVLFERKLETFSNHQNPRFHDLTVLAQCRLTSDPLKSKYDPGAGDPVQGQFAWFKEKPADILPVHNKSWVAIEDALH